MSINTAHSGDKHSLIIFSGERILICYKGCEITFGTKDIPLLKGSSKGRAYLTSHRVIFINDSQNAALKSVSMPLFNMTEVDIKQPVFGANYIEGMIKGESDGGFPAETLGGPIKFKLYFTRGGAIEFGRSILETGRRVTSNRPAASAYQPPPSYAQLAAMQYYAAPPPAYAPPYADPYYNFVQRHDEFYHPAQGEVYMWQLPPPYPGAGPGFVAPPPPADPSAPPPQYNAMPAYYNPTNPHQVYAPQAEQYNYAQAPPYPAPHQSDQSYGEQKRAL